MSYALYSYAWGTDSNQKVRSDALNWRGFWTANGTYSALAKDAVQRVDARYISVGSSLGADPVKCPAVFRELVVVTAGTEPPFD